MDGEKEEMNMGMVLAICFVFQINLKRFCILFLSTLVLGNKFGVLVLVFSLPKTFVFIWKFHRNHRWLKLDRSNWHLILTSDCGQIMNNISLLPKI